MSTEAARVAAAAALRDLNHAFARQDADDEVLHDLAREARVRAAALDAAPRRDRLALMRAVIEQVGSEGFPMGSAGSGFGDRAVAGNANPTSVDIDVEFEDVDVVGRFLLGRAFEGAPGRAHGGIVAAVFDDVTGFIIGQLREPAFTGELTVRYEKPVPIETPLEMRARLVDRERRKLFITAECRDGDTVVATGRAIYITVDPARFAGAPDPR
jgi:acyl-coenzyme A thioesterase PaaI-like protein